jgi:hypothetical protein
VESSSSPVVQAKVVREIASKPPEPRVIKFDEVAKEVLPKKILPAKNPHKIEVKLQPSIKPLIEPKATIDILPESENILVNLIDQVVESSVSIPTTPASSSTMVAAEKVSPQEESLHGVYLHIFYFIYELNLFVFLEFLTFKKSDDLASKKVLAMLQEEPTESVEVSTSLPSLESGLEVWYFLILKFLFIKYCNWIRLREVLRRSSKTKMPSGCSVPATWIPIFIF